jgi:hypothetical protein
MIIAEIIKLIIVLFLTLPINSHDGEVASAEIGAFFRTMYLAKTGEDFIGPNNTGPNGKADQHIKLINLKTDVPISKIQVIKGSQIWEHPSIGGNGIKVFGSGSQRDLFIESEVSAPYEVKVIYSDNSLDSSSTNFGKPSSYGLSVAGSIRDSRLNINEGLAISGNYAYVTGNTNNRLNVIDISDPKAPQIVGSLQHSFLAGAEDLFVSGNYAYVTTEAPGTNRLTIVDISNPRSPTIKGSVQDSVRLLSTEDVFVLNNYAFVTAEEGDRLTIVNVQNKSAPKIVGSIKDSTRLNGPEGIWVVGSYAYIASEIGNSLTIVDVANPAKPVIKGYIKSSLLDGASGIQVSGNYAYVAVERSSRFTIVNISNPSQPKIVSSFSSEYIKDTDNLTLAGNTVYVSAHEGSSVAAIDVTSKSKPYIREYIYDNTNLRASNAVQVSGGYLWVTAQLEDGSNTSRLTSVELPNESLIANTSAQDIIISSPADGSSISNVINIKATSNVQNPSVVNVEIGSQKVGYCRKTPCSLEYNTSLLQSGTHDIKATAYDKFGNVGIDINTVTKN